MSRLEAVIFDVDGTLIDTEQIQSDAFLQVLREHGHHQAELTEHGTVHIPGETTGETWDRLKKYYDLPSEIETLTERKRRAVLTDLQTELTALPGVMRIIDELNENGIKMAAASSAQKERLGYILRGLKVFSYFDVIISANDVNNVKPAPDAYLAAAEKLHIVPENCVVIEDTAVGVASAKAAGMKVMAVPNRYTESMDFSAADLIVGSLEDVNYAKLLKLCNDSRF